MGLRARNHAYIFAHRQWRNGPDRRGADRLVLMARVVLFARAGQPALDGALVLVLPRFSAPASLHDSRRAGDTTGAREQPGPPVHSVASARPPNHAGDDGRLLLWLDAVDFSELDSVLFCSELQSRYVDCLVLFRIRPICRRDR